MTLNPQNASPLKILIADDDPPTRLLLHAAIAQWGFDVIDVKDGEEVWNILQQPNPPKLLILDWLMPKIDGLTLCTRIKSELKLNPYIILLTQVTGTSNIIKALESGANEFLSKPFNMAELRSRISVGARIIQYEAELAAQNIELQEYIKQLETIAKLESTVSKNIDELLSSSEKLGASSDCVDHIKKINDLKYNLTSVISLINSYQKASKR